jgi:hypothetical protein
LQKRNQLREPYLETCASHKGDIGLGIGGFITGQIQSLPGIDDCLNAATNWL